MIEATAMDIVGEVAGSGERPTRYGSPAPAEDGKTRIPYITCSGEYLQLRTSADSLKLDEWFHEWTFLDSEHR